MSETPAPPPSSAPLSEQPADPTAGVPRETPDERRRRSLATTPRDMFISMVVIVGVVLVLVLLVPRPNSLPERVIDVAAAAQADGSELGFTPAVPQGLPDGWVARAAAIQRTTDDLKTWHVTYTTPTGRYAGIQETKNATPAWESRQVTDGKEQSTRQIGGQEWVVRSRVDRGTISLVLRDGDLTTVVTGTATQAEIDQFAGSLTSS